MISKSAHLSPNYHLADMRYFPFCHHSCVFFLSYTDMLYYRHLIFSFIIAISEHITVSDRNVRQCLCLFASTAVLVTWYSVGGRGNDSK